MMESSRRATDWTRGGPSTFGALGEIHSCPRPPQRIK